MLHLVGIKNCDKIRKTRAWLEDHAVEYVFIDVKKEPLTRHELEELSVKVGLDVLVNKKGMMWRKLGLAEQNLSDEELITVLEQHQNMMKRPVLLYEEAVLVGYDEQAFELFLKDHGILEA
ncbi:MAG: Spx/MgsR family RNA polymerase-binding regulatory protein [Bacteroidota bacterium]